MWKEEQGGLLSLGTDLRHGKGRSARLALNPDELGRLWSVIDSLEADVLLHLAVCCGFRRLDLVSLEVSNLPASCFGDGEVVGGEIKFFEQKKRRNWSVAVPKDMVILIRKWLATIKAKKSRYVFPAHRGAGHLSDRQAWNILNKYLEKAGITKPEEVRPFHSLRATFVKTAQRNGWSVAQVCRQTGDSTRVIEEIYSMPSDAEMGAQAESRPVGF